MYSGGVISVTTDSLESEMSCFNNVTSKSSDVYP